MWSLGLNGYLTSKILKSMAKGYAATEQVIGREGETATFIWRCLLNSELRGFGFAPRQLRRSAASLLINLR